MSIAGKVIGKPGTLFGKLVVTLRNSSNPVIGQTGTFTNDSAVSIVVENNIRDPR